MPATLPVGQPKKECIQETSKGGGVPWSCKCLGRELHIIGLAAEKPQVSYSIPFHSNVGQGRYNRPVGLDRWLGPSAIP